MYQKYIVQVTKLIPSNSCKKIISYFEDSLEEARITGDGLTPVGEVNKKIRNCSKNQLYPLFDKKVTFGQTLTLNYIKSKIQEAIELYHSVLNHNPHSKFTVLKQIDFLKYESNSVKTGYSWHVDSGPTVGERSCTLSISLNNDYEGGAFKIMVDTNEMTYVQNEGDCLMFPSSFMFPHQVEPVKKGTRYALVAWVT